MVAWEVKMIICIKDKITGNKNYIEVGEDIPNFIREHYEIIDYEEETQQNQVAQPQITLEEAKKKKRYEILQAFKNQFAQGMYSQTLGTTIDCRKIPFQEQEDLQNIKVLLNYMRTNNIQTTYYRDFFNNNIPNVTQEMLEQVIAEMEAYGVAQYMKKHQLDDAIEAAQTIEEVNEIHWEGGWHEG